jgi:hypothetical protein
MPSKKKRKNKNANNCFLLGGHKEKHVNMREKMQSAILARKVLRVVAFTVCGRNSGQCSALYN